MVHTPKLMDLAKTYFNCPSMTGLRMENQGGPGTANSHWDRAELGDEMMTGASIDE